MAQKNPKWTELVIKMNNTQLWSYSSHFVWNQSRSDREIIGLQIIFWGELYLQLKLYNH